LFIYAPVARAISIMWEFCDAAVLFCLHERKTTSDKFLMIRIEVSYRLRIVEFRTAFQESLMNGGYGYA